MSDSQTKIAFRLPPEGRDCHRILLRVDPADIAYVVMIVEAYEGLGIPRTVNQAEGIMEILVSPDFKEDARSLIGALSKDIGVEVIRI